MRNRLTLLLVLALAGCPERKSYVYRDPESGCGAVLCRRIECTEEADGLYKNCIESLFESECVPCPDGGAP